MVLKVLVILLFLCSSAYGDALLTWDAPTQNEDGTPITDLAGYKVYRGYTSGLYTDTVDVGMLSGSTVSFTYTNLKEGDNYFTVTSYDLSGNESDYSNEVKKNIIIKPKAPGNLR